MKRSISFLALAASLYLVTPQRAQEPHMDLVRGLRAKSYHDLALEYLAELGKRKDLPADIAAALPLEVARTQIEMAKDMSDASRRAALFAQARQNFQAFLKANPASPLAAEVKLDLARMVSTDARVIFNRAREQAGEARRATLMAARAQFAEAGKSFAEAETGIADLLAKDNKNAKIAQAKLEAEYEKAVNLLDQLLTYEGDKDVGERNKIAAQTKNALEKFIAENDKNSTGWMAKAWMLKYLDETDQFLEADSEYKKSFAKLAGGYVEPGKRMAKSFLIQMWFRKDATGKEGFNEVTKNGREWLTEYRPFAGTPEGNAVRFALGSVLKNQADKDPKAKDSVEQYVAAEKLFDELEVMENEFTERARTAKTEILLKRKPELLQTDIKKLTNFRECYVRAQLEVATIGALEKQRPADLDKKLAQHQQNIIDVLNRGLELADQANVSATERIDARFLLVYYLMVTGKPYKAAVMGEEVARKNPTSSRAGLTGGYALSAYAQVMEGDGKDLPKDVKQADLLPRTRELANYIETNWKNELAADAARHQLGAMAFKEKNYPAAVEALARISSPAYPMYSQAQYLMASAALEAQKEKVPPPKGKASWGEFAISVFEKIPEPKNLDPEQNRSYFHSKVRLLQLYFPAKKYDEMDKLVTSLRARFKLLEDRKIAGLDEIPGLLMPMIYYAAYGKADTLFNSDAKDRYTKVRTLLDPLVDQLGGEMTKLAQIKAERAKLEQQDKKDKKTEDQIEALNNKEKDIFQVDPSLYLALLGLDLRSNVLDGQIDRAKKLLDLLQRTAGDFENSGRILVSLVQQFTTQIKELEKKGDKFKAEKDKLVAALAAFLDELAKQPLDKMRPEILRFLSISYSELGKHEQAAKLLDKVPEPGAAAKADDMKFYYTIRLMLAREYRLSKKLEDADKTIAPLKKTDWGGKSLDLRKEEIHLMEAKEFYGLAANNWNKLVGELKQLVDRGGNPQAKDHYNEAFFGFVSCMYQAGIKNKDAKKRDDYIARAARLIVTLETNDQMGNMKDKYQELLEKEAPLKVKVEEMRKEQPKTGAAGANAAGK